MSATTVTRPASPVDVVVLQYVNPTRLLTIPIGFLLLVVVVMIAVTAIVQANDGPATIDHNGAVVWSLSGYIVATGVQAVSVGFPLALALGATRRTFALGVLATSLVQSVLLTAAALVLLGLELATGGWFVGARVLSDATLGGGDAAVLAVSVLLGSMAAMAVGGIFGAAFVRFGSRGPAVLGIVLAAAATLALVAFLPGIIAFASGFRTWWLVVAAVVLIALGTTGEYVLLRRANVR